MADELSTDEMLKKHNLYNRIDEADEKFDEKELSKRTIEELRVMLLEYKNLLAEYLGESKHG